MVGTKKLAQWVVAVLGLTLVAPLAPAQEPETDDTEAAKGLFYAPVPKPRPGVKFNIVEIEGKNLDKRKKRKTSHDFKPGDRLNFEFEVNRPGYVYILNRTILGHPDRLRRYYGRGISVIMAEDLGRAVNVGPRNARYTLLYPTGGAGTDNFVHKGQLRVVPQSGHFVMDNEPGIEKLFFVWSPAPIDMSQYFDMQTGRLLTATFAGKGVGGEDQETDTLDQLNGDLNAWAGNAEVSMAKGMNVESYGLGVNDQGPMMVEIDLTHKPR